MPAPSDEPLSRTNLYLYTSDKEWLYIRYGHGWSEIIRNLVRQHRREEEAENQVITIRAPNDRT